MKKLAEAELRARRNDHRVRQSRLATGKLKMALRALEQDEPHTLTGPRYSHHRIRDWLWVLSSSISRSNSARKLAVLLAVWHLPGALFFAYRSSICRLQLARRGAAAFLTASGCAAISSTNDVDTAWKNGACT
jgi:hypothetical protein